MPPRKAGRPAPVISKVSVENPRWLKPAILILAAVLLVGWFSTEVADTDAWWHLKTGEYIVEHRALPAPDPFAYTTYTGKPAYPGEERIRYFNLTHEWLAQIVLYLAYAAAGFPGLILLRALLLAATCGLVGWIAHRRTGGFYGPVIAALLAASIAQRFASDRPFVFTFLLVALTTAVVEDRKRLWILPPLYLVWANLHGGYFLGWAVLGVYCAEAWLSRETADWRNLWLVSGVCIVVSGLNPNGFRAVLVTAAYQSSVMQTTLTEWQHTAVWPLEMFGVILIGALAALLWARRRARLTDWVLYLAFAAASIWAVRNVMLIGIVGPVIITTYFRWQRPVPRAAVYGAATLLLAASVAGAARGRMFQFRAADWKFPGGASRFLEAHHVTGRMFNTYEFGGYLIWRLFPLQRVFIDGRALNESVFLDYRRIAYNAGDTGGKSAEELLAQYGIEVILMDGFEFTSGAPYLLVAALSDPSQKEWKLVYRDAQAVVFMRRPPTGAQPLSSFEALAAMEEQCEEHLRHDPGHPACARGMADLFARIGDGTRAVKWNTVAANQRP